MAAAVVGTLPKSSILQNSSVSRKLDSYVLSGSPLKGICCQTKPKRRKSRVSSVVAAAAARGGDAGGGGRFYFNITGFPFPLGPFLNRRTVRYELLLSFQIRWLLVPIQSSVAAEEDGSHQAPPCSSNSMLEDRNLDLDAEEQEANKALVECEGDSIDLSTWVLLDR